MANHIFVKSDLLFLLSVGDRLRCRMHPSEVYEVEAVEAERQGVTLARAFLRQIRKPGARRRAKTDLIALTHLEENYEKLGGKQ